MILPILTETIDVPAGCGRNALCTKSNIYMIPNHATIRIQIRVRVRVA